MENEYLVNSDDLMAVADAIRVKGGTSEALVFPSGFVSAVQAIQAGSGGGIEMLTGSFTPAERVTEYTIELDQPISNIIIVQSIPATPSGESTTYGKALVPGFMEWTIHSSLSGSSWVSPDIGKGKSKITISEDGKTVKAYAERYFGQTKYDWIAW